MRPRGFFGVLGWLLVGLRFAVVLFWVVVALAAYLYLPALGDSTSSSLSDVVPESAPAAKAEAQAEGLSGSVEAPAILVYSNPGGFTGADLEEMRGGVQSLNGEGGRPYGLLRAVPLAAQNSSNPTRVDRGLLGNKALPVLLYFEGGARLAEVAASAREVREDLDAPGPLRTSVTGIKPVQYDTKVAIEGNLSLVTVVTTLAIFLVVALTYRSPVAPLVPPASIGRAPLLPPPGVPRLGALRSGS